jgi:hypothetical protein
MERAGVRGDAGSPFAAFLRFSDWLYARVGRTDSIALPRLAELLFTHLTTGLGHAPGDVAEILGRDWERGGRRDRPEFLRSFPSTDDARPRETKCFVKPRRQARHQSGAA